MGSNGVFGLSKKMRLWGKENARFFVHDSTQLGGISCLAVEVSGERTERRDGVLSKCRIG